VGTSSTKAVLITTAGELIATAVREHRVQHPAPGHVEMDPELWWNELVGLTRELLTGRDVALAAVGVSGMGPCVAVTNSKDEPLRPAMLYGIDTRAEAEIATLTDQLGDDAIVSRCGSSLTTQAVGPKLAWLGTHEPEVFAAARHIYTSSSFLVRRLTGEYVLDQHSASQADPLYDIEAERWYDPWWSELAGPLVQPPLRWPSEIAGVVTPSASSDTLIPRGTPVIAGTIDAWAEAASVGAHQVGDLMLMYGSTMFLIHSVERTLRSPTLWSTVGVSPGTRSLAGGMATSGSITAWLKELFGNVTHERLLEEARNSGPGAHGLLVLPYFAGERTPIADPRARGVIAGLTLSHTRGDVYRAVLEATAFAVRHNIDAMTAAGATISRVVAVGGGARGDLWIQIVSDATGCTQVVPTHLMGASFGIAFLAAAAIADPDISEWNPPHHLQYPSVGITRLYDARYDEYRELYRASEDVIHKLAREQLRVTTPHSEVV
jgi:xylulokinase